MIPSDLARHLLGMELEIESVLRADDVRDLGVRDECSIVRGALELMLRYGEPADLAEIEKRLASVSDRIGQPQWRHQFLLRLRQAMWPFHLAA